MSNDELNLALAELICPQDTMNEFNAETGWRFVPHEGWQPRDFCADPTITTAWMEKFKFDVAWSPGKTLQYPKCSGIFRVGRYGDWSFAGYFGRAVAEAAYAALKQKQREAPKDLPHH